ncbi:MAG: AAA family ATPase [Acidobacteria bacterium]|nr:AAA family ATPase [Acidobacteriota bacterium]
MESNDEVLSALLTAVQVSPDSAPLRRHYAEMLLNRGYAEEAEVQFRHSLDLDPSDAATKLGLARALHSQNQNGKALLLVKQVIRQAARPAKAYILYARLLLALGSVERAVREYRKAVDEDPRASDPQLASELGLAIRPAVPPPPDTDETPPPTPETSIPETVRQLFAERPALSFQQVGGRREIKDELERRLVRPWRETDTVGELGRALGSRFLLYGPPGCGKSHLGRALAGELLARYLALSLQDLVEIWRGDSGRLLREIFAQARSSQDNVVLVFDEVEHLGGEPSLVQQFLSELSQLEPDEGVVVVITTAAPWKALPPLVRKERFDRILFVPPPSTAERGEILRVLCQGKPQNFLSTRNAAELTEGCAVADLRKLVEKAIEQRLQQSLQEGRPLPLTTADLVRAAEETSPSIPPWLEQARAHAASLPPGFEALTSFLKLN